MHDIINHVINYIPRYTARVHLGKSVGILNTTMGGYLGWLSQTGICTRMYTYMFAYLHICTHICIFKRMYGYIFAYVYICVRICVNMHAFWQICAGYNCSYMRRKLVMTAIMQPYTHIRKRNNTKYFFPTHNINANLFPTCLHNIALDKAHREPPTSGYPHKTKKNKLNFDFEI